MANGHTAGAARPSVSSNCSAARFETGAMLTTSNRSIAEWGVVFADPMDATAILDRFLHHNHVHPW